MNPTGLTPGGLRLPESDTRRGLRLLLLVTAGLALGALIGVLLFVAVYARFAASLPPADAARLEQAR